MKEQKNNEQVSQLLRIKWNKLTLRDGAVPAPESAAKLAKATAIVHEVIAIDNVETKANREEESEE